MSNRIRLAGFLLVLILILMNKTGLGMGVRVVITDNDFKSLVHPELQVQADGNIMLVCYSNSLNTNSPISLKPTEDGVIVITEEQEVLMDSPVWIYPPVNDKLEISSIIRGGEQKFIPSYHGFLEVHSIDGQSLQVINQVGLEEYLYGVVPSEMPVTWPLEAIKAQAIASRTYVVRVILEAEQEGQAYHVVDGVFSQVYNNRMEDCVARLAVDLTRGLIMVDSSTNNLVKAYFHSTSGGITASAGDVWGHARNSFPNNGTPYLQARAVAATAFDYNLKSEKQVSEFLKRQNIVSYEQDSPWYRWQVALSVKELEQIINANLAKRYQIEPDFILTKQPNGEFASKPIPQVGIGELQALKVVERGLGGNILTLEVQGTTGVYHVIKELNIRYLLQPTNQYTGGADIIIKRMADQVSNYHILPSAFCTFEILADKVIIYGGGNGHGVGMSQWGAKGMAEAGYNYHDILESFYTDIELVNVYEFANVGISI